MMKRLLIILVLFLVPNAGAQDTLVFTDGTIKAVKIIEIDTGINLLCYVNLSPDTICIDLGQIKTYYLYSDLIPKDDTDLNQKKDSIVFIPGQRKSPRKRILKKIFTNPSKFNYGNLSIATNLSSPIGFLSTNSSNSHTSDKRIFFSYNMVFSIEPEIKVSNKFSIKFPLILGLTRENLPLNSQGYLSSDQASQAWRYNKSKDHNLPPSLLGENYYTHPYINSIFDHGKELRFQIGISPKFYPFGQTKIAFYMEQGIHLGLGDLYSVDYFHYFDTTSVLEHNTSWPYVEQWKLVEEKSVINKNPFLYFRYEALIGLDFNLTRSFSFSIQTGFSTGMMGKGKQKDRVYQKLINGDYQLIFEEHYRNKELSGGYFINRIHLVYRFGGESR